MAPSETPENPRFEQRLLAYIDILGWQATTNAGEEQRIWKAVEAMALESGAEAKSRTQLNQAGFNAGRSVRMSTFSDTIVYSCAPEPDEAAWLVLRSQATCVALLAAGHYARGALTLGELVHTERLLAGRALVEAHKIERDVAKYPRLVVSDAAETFLTDAKSKLSPTLRIPVPITRDNDSLPYLEIFPFVGNRAREERVRTMVEALRGRVLEDLERTKSSPTDHAQALNHRAKYGWMLSYLDAVLDDPVSILNWTPAT